MKIYLLLLPLLSALILPAAEHEQLKAYPAAEEGQVRHVIVVPYMANEDDLKVEVFVGRTMMTDGANMMRMGGKFEREVIKGWGYPYYTAELGPVASTMMAPRPGQEEEKFVHMQGEMIRYNSKLPIVIYTPEGVEVRYRIWEAGETKEVE